MNKENSELFAQYQKLAKKADARMRSLERLAASDSYFQAATKYAYNRAVKDIKSMFGESPKARFNRMLPNMNKVRIVSAINDVKRFLESESSLKSGIVKGYQRRVDTINKKFGTKFTWKEFADFVEMGGFDWGAEKYGSSTILTRIGKIQKGFEDKKLPDEIEDFTSKHTTTKDIQTIMDSLYDETATIDLL